LGHGELREVQLLLAKKRYRAGERPLHADRGDARLGGGAARTAATAAAAAPRHDERAERRRGDDQVSSHRYASPSVGMLHCRGSQLGVRPGWPGVPSGQPPATLASIVISVPVRARETVQSLAFLARSPKRAWSTPGTSPTVRRSIRVMLKLAPTWASVTRAVVRRSRAG